ncbi:MAG: glucosamine-6-phosphate deaminase [Verrucomicrobiales bacterium]
MNIHVFPNKTDLGQAAAEAGAARLRLAVETRGQATIIVATGASQFEMLSDLVTQPNIRWDKVTVFHLDEYVGMPITHGASFRRYLWERFHSKLPLPVRAFHYLDGEADPAAECARVAALLLPRPVDVAFIGIGENGHIAFNDPPADFETGQPYIIVELDEACRRQQLGEGWFPTFADVPTRAISMSIRQVLKSAFIVCTVPDARKAQAVRGAVQGPITPDVPASILQTHAACELFLDEESAAKLDPTRSS